MKITLLSVSLLVFAGFAGDSGLYSYKPKGTNDIAEMSAEIVKLRTIIAYDAKIENCLNRKIEILQCKIRVLEFIIEEIKKEVK